MNMKKAVQQIGGSTAGDETVDLDDTPHVPLSQDDYEALTECPYQRYKPNIIAGPPSTKREAQSPAGTNSSKKHRYTDSAPKVNMSSQPKTVITVTLDSDEKPATRTHAGRLHSDPLPCSGPPVQKAVEQSLPGQVQPPVATPPPTNTSSANVAAEPVVPSTSAAAPAVVPPAKPTPAEVVNSAVLAAVTMPPVTSAEPSVTPPQQPIVANAAANVTAAAEPAAPAPVPAAQVLSVPDQPVEHSQGGSEAYAAAAHFSPAAEPQQFSPAVEPQQYGPVDMNTLPGIRLPLMREYWQQNELAPYLLTDQEALEQQGGVDDDHIAPSTPECNAELDKADEEI